MNPIKVSIHNVDSKNYKNPILNGLQTIDFQNIVKSDSNILIKPNFTWPFYKKGVTTSPLLLNELTKILKNYADKLFIGESNGANNSWSAEKVFKGHGLYQTAKENGFELINLSKKPSINRSTVINNKKITLKVSKFILDKIDLLITVPVLKIHAATIVSLGLKNQWGCLPDPMRLLCHPFLHEGIVAVNKIYNPQISIIDATYGLDLNGPIFGNPIKLNKIMVSNNVVGLDILACEFMGISYDKVKHISIAKKELLKNIDLKKITKYGEFINHFKFELKKNFYNYISNFIFFHEKFNNLFYDSLFSKYIQKILQLFKILFKQENAY